MSKINKIKAARKAKGIKARQLAEMVGLTPASISKIERGLGGVRPTTAKKIADALGIPVVDVLFPSAEDEEKAAA